MCGIFGMVSLMGRPLRRPELLHDVAASLTHRGPDAAGALRSAICAIGATRLRIVDPTPLADQPFATADNRTWLACNGEIYNSESLRRRFAAYAYRSRSDIEVILPAYQVLGIDVFRELDGMFAAALWDADRRTLVLARDRAGEKPLFYARIGGELWFASEIQALLAHPGLPRNIDETAVSQYLSLGYPLEPRTMFAAIRRVQAGTALIVNAFGLRVHRYWDPLDVAREPAVKVDREELRDVLCDAVRRQLPRDRTVGVFLSGGLDSSLITTIAARSLGPDRVCTFTARFDSPSYDEGRWARRVADLTAVRHFDVHCNTDALLRALRVLTSRLAEPISDPALLPTYLLSEAASEHLRIMLSGEGADELFGGYPTYLGHMAAERFARTPAPLKRALIQIIHSLPTSEEKVSIEFLLKRFATGAGLPWLERHLRWFGTGASMGLRAPNDDDSMLPALEPLLERFGNLDARTGPMALDYESYLRDLLLVKMDRATMLNSIEGRAPYLDRALSTLALRLSPQLKVRGWTTKWALKDAAREWLPNDLRRRRKRGLSVPIAQWINAELGPVVDRLLAPERLGQHGLMDPGVIGRLLQEHRTHRANHAKALWSAIILQLWLERWQPALAGSDPLIEAAPARSASTLSELQPQLI